MEIIAEELAQKYNVKHLSGPQGHVLLFLCKHDEEEIFVKDIEKELKISKSVTSNLVKRMEKNGFVEIVPSEVDRRCKRVILTAEGLRKIQPLKAFHEEMRQQLFQGISWDDLALVHRIVHQLQENISKYMGGKHV